MGALGRLSMVFYGVLWVKWIEGVAYRRGCAYVQKELWKEQHLEDVGLILGYVWPMPLFTRNQESNK
jgi:hypothetical protein